MPLVALLVICAKMQRIKDRARLSLLKNCLIAYLAADALLGLVTFRFSLPCFVGFLFYARGWWFYIVFLIRYGQFQLAVNLALDVLYWIAFGFLLVELSDLIEPLAANAAERGESAASGGQKVSASFKIAVASMLLLALQTALNACLWRAWREIRSDSGEHAVGVAFVALLLLAAKFLCSLPVLIPAIVGIVKACRQKNKALRYNRQGLWINSACLLASLAQVFLWW